MVANTFLGLVDDEDKTGRRGLVAGLMRMREEVEVMLLDLVGYIGGVVFNIFLIAAGTLIERYQLFPNDIDWLYLTN